MIGVIAKPDQNAIVEEFFELFKTPWEVYQPGRVYDVVVATADQIPQPAPKVFISYGATPKNVDGPSLVPDQCHPGGMVAQQDGSVPIYAGLLSFKAIAPATVCLTADIGAVGIRPGAGDASVVRVGYDLFEEVRFLLSTGQPVANADVPTLDLHIDMLRNWILAAGIPLLEVLPSPAGYGFGVCLTHDIDFVGIRRHKLDHTMWGFLYRSTIGAVYNAGRGRIPVRRLLKMWRAVASLPLVYLGWVKDFWEPFAWYLKAEANLPSTYYLIPFKGRPGDQVSSSNAARRATAYDVSDVQDWAARLLDAGCEVGVHGIDAWRSIDKGRDELARISAVTGQEHLGIRMHWLLRNAGTAAILDHSGYLYDSTIGYNDTIGYHAGTGQVFRPLGARTLLELPMHIQDGALFYPQKLDLSESEAENRCERLIENARRFGGVLTVLWHDRSHGPERYWGDFYVRLVDALRSSNAWFGTGSQVVRWFGRRRDVRFERVEDRSGTRVVVRDPGEEIFPQLCVRVHRPPSGGASADAARTAIDRPWNGVSALELDAGLWPVSGLSEPLAAMASR